MASGASPSPTGSTTSPTNSAKSSNEVELQRKRARDRKSQQAMRDRNRWTIHNLTEHVAFLTRAGEERTKDIAMLNTKLQTLESENEHLRVENAALRLSMMGENTNQQSQLSPITPICPPWETPPNNTPPTCLADQILQTFVESRRCGSVTSATSPSARGTTYPSIPNLCSLLDKDQRTEDETSNVVCDIVRSYTEIETLPKQVAVHYVMSTLLKWTVLLDEHSYNLMPAWLRPVPAQLVTPHAAWIDRIPWPKVRGYLVAHPEITLDDFAAVYSSSFTISWQYDPSLVLITTGVNENGIQQVIANPIYDEHIRQLTNWTIGDAFRNRFPDVAKLIDEEPSDS